MYINFYFILVQFILAILMLLYSVDGEERQHPKMPAALKKFTARLIYEILQIDSNKNVVFSPLPIEVYLTLLSFGASDEMKHEMLQSLYFEQQTDEDILKYFDQFMVHLSKYTTKNFDIIMNTQIVGRELKHSFKKIANKYFQTAYEIAEKFDSSRLNRYVAGQTNQKFKKFLHNNDFRQSTYAALINCLYMEGSFAQKFNESFTIKGDFYNYGKYKEKVDMMHMWAKMNFADIPELNATSIILPYESEHVKLMLMLPNERSGLSQMEEALATMKDIQSFTLPLEEKNVEIMLPKFSLQYNIKLRKIMARVGMGTAFSNNATFTDIFEEAIFSKFDQLKQISYFDVSESGSGATSSMFINLVKRQKRSASVDIGNSTPIASNSNSRIREQQSHFTNVPFF